MELSKKDRLLLINQYKILAALNKDDEGHYLELIEILERGYKIFYSQIDEWVSDDMDERASKLVLRILNLYRAIEDLKRTTRDERLLSHQYSFFRGFDGNNESAHMAFCRFLVDTQGKFQEQEAYRLKSDNFNSHMPMIDKYERMLALSGNALMVMNLDVDRALEILDA